MSITPFNFQGKEVRVIADDPEKPLWVARDVATALGYKNTTDAIQRHCRGVVNHYPIKDRLGRTQNVRVIAEPDLYRLIVGSDLDTAQEFERMVFEEVLPSIRKHGAYMTSEAIEKALTNPDTIIQLATTLKEEQARRAELETQAKENAPKVLFANAVATAKTDILVGDLAKILKGNGIEVGANRLFKWMRENGFLIARKGTDWNMPTQKSMELGLFRVKETVIQHSDGHVGVSKTSKVTGKGQEYFVSRFMDGRFTIDRNVLTINGVEFDLDEKLTVAMPGRDGEPGRQETFRLGAASSADIHHFFHETRSGSHKRWSGRVDDLEMLAREIIAQRVACVQDLKDKEV